MNHEYYLKFIFEICWSYWISDSEKCNAFPSEKQVNFKTWGLLLHLQFLQLLLVAQWF